MPAVKPKDDRYAEFAITWRGIALNVRHCPDWSRSCGIAHIEVISLERLPLPITETGYKSHFIHHDQRAEIGTPVEFVIAWLDHDAESTAWKKAEFESRQLSLF
jgi:hypothetical protein